MEQRLKFIDCLRGMSMLFVVFHHIIVMGMRDTIGGDTYNSPINDFIITIQMPLFFFVSGFVSARLNKEWSTLYIYKTIMKKVRGQLMPTVVMFFTELSQVKIHKRDLT